MQSRAAKKIFNDEITVAYQVSVLIFVFKSDVISGTQLIPENSLHHQDKLVVGDILKQKP